MSDVIITGAGSNTSVDAQVDATHQALRANLRPLEHVSQGLTGGHYYLTASYSNTAAKPAANSDVLSLRWTDSRFFFALKKLSVWVTTTTTYTATLNQDLAGFVARNFTVSASAGTQVIPLAGGQAARSTNMRKSGLDGSGGVLWVSSGDLLTTGTRTLDTQPFGYAAYQNAITTPNLPTQAILYEYRDTGMHPLILGANEGIVIQTPIGNAQAAGVSKYTFQFVWGEVPQY